MRLLMLTLVNIKRSLKNPMNIIMTFVFPLGIMFFSFAGHGGSELGGIGIINKDRGAYAQELVDSLDKNYSISYYDSESEDLEKSIKKNKLGAIYLFEEDFSKKIKDGEKPKVKVYKTSDEVGGVLADSEIEKFINNKIVEAMVPNISENIVKSEIERPKGNNYGEYIMSLNMICYFLLIGASTLSDEVIRLRTQKVLRRSITTANRDYEVLGGIFLSNFVFQAVLSSLAFLVARVVLDVKVGSIPLAVLAICLTSFIGSSLILFTIRWMKNPAISNMFLVMYSLITFVLSMVSMNAIDFEGVPEIIINLSRLSPFHWIVNMLNGGSVVVSTIILILMGVCFFTAGSFRMRDFVKD